jgi:hypothetical protein
MSPTLEDQERHLLVKVIDRILYKLDDLVRPYVHKILVVIEPLLIDEDYYARVEGREIISNLAKVCIFIKRISVNATVYNISVILWLLVLSMVEVGVPEESQKLLRILIPLNILLSYYYHQYASVIEI